MQINLKIEAYKNMFDFQIERKANFEEVETKKRRYLKIDKVRYYLLAGEEDRAPFPIYSLGLIGKAKKEVLKNYYAKNISFENNIKVDLFQCIKQPFSPGGFKGKNFYYRLNDNWKREKVVTELENSNPPANIWEGEVIQIDINSAYLATAQNLGLLSKETYNKFFQIEENEKEIKKRKKDKLKEYRDSATGSILRHSKPVRLVTLGTLAQDKTITEYKAGQIVGSRREYNEEEANIFFSIARIVGEAMIKVIKECKTAKFSFVDAVFVEPEEYQKAADILTAAGYKHKFKKCYLKQDGGRFESWNIADDGTLSDKSKKYYISPGKTPGILEGLYKKDFLDEILKTYNILREEEPETARKALVRCLKSTMKIDSLQDYNVIHLAEKLKKYGLLLEDVFKISAKIIEQKEDSFGLLSVLVSDRIINLREKDLFFKQNPLEETTEERDILGEKIVIHRDLNINLI